MLATLRKRLDRDEEGFTLIELMVVVLIIAILLAIAIPTFLGAQDRARDRAAQSNLRNAITAAKTIATDNDGFFFSTGTVVINASDLSSVEGSLTFENGAVVGTGDDVGTVYVGTVPAAGTPIHLMAKSGSGKYFCMSATSGGKVTYGSGAAFGNVDAATDCLLAKF